MVIDINDIFSPYLQGFFFFFLSFKIDFNLNILVTNVEARNLAGMPLRAMEQWQTTGNPSPFSWDQISG